MPRRYYVYIMTNRWHTVLYTGVTNNPYRRTDEHRSGRPNSFTQRYRVTKVVFLEEFSTPIEAIAAEKKIKGWTRAKKIALIESLNPTWEELLPHEESSEPSR